MFENIGKKIKSLCKIVFYVLVSCSLLGGLICFISVFVSNNEPEFEQIFGGFFLMVLICGLGVFFSWILVLFIYAFGELVDSGTILVKQNKKIIALLSGEEQDEVSSVKFFSQDNSNVEKKEEQGGSIKYDL